MSAESNADSGTEHESHAGHSDDLLTLLSYKIRVQQLQAAFAKEEQSYDNLSQQGVLIQRMMPVLNAYMKTPKSYYLTAQMYHDSLENRAAMLSDFADILVKYQKQLVSMP